MSPLDLPHDVRRRLARLAIVPRGRSGLGGVGIHASRNRGTGMEFAQYRPYERGDELRSIDWKLYARSDRFFVRDAERESPLAVWIILDASASMAQADLATPGWSRFDAARRLAAAIAAVALAQGDRFGLIVEGGGAPIVVAPGSGPRHRDRLHLALAPLAATGVADWEGARQRLGERIGRDDVAIVLTDGFDEACIATIEALAASGRDLCTIRLFTADERDFPFDSGYRFTDAESGASVIGDGPALREQYLTRFAAARAAKEARLEAAGVRHTESYVDRPADEPIAALFDRRARR
ncbi:DUF58 domain-containing protein [Sphingomonas sp. 37zxx]|uniref:DUF58 domain-containing protein n=1 Tax=Sphingomonas sp. 37zxx TaxID=1550073 RepID=UPI00053BEB60|nr:DUF58 domain-containing protein [Sphingomonas sp. 37zxx]